MTEKWIVDDCGTLINMQTRDTFDYVSDVCDVLNEKDKSIKILTNHNKEYVCSINILEDKLKKLKELEKENEMLKEENQELRHFKLSIKSFAECNENINSGTLNDLIELIDYD